MNWTVVHSSNAVFVLWRFWGKYCVSLPPLWWCVVRSSCAPCPATCRTDPHVCGPPPNTDPTCEDNDGLTPPLIGSLRTWTARIMDRIWMFCGILLFVGANASLSDGDDDASCDGAFDIYFVLDRWVCVCVCVGAGRCVGCLHVWMGSVCPSTHVRALLKSPYTVFFYFLCTPVKLSYKWILFISPMFILNMSWLGGLDLLPWCCLFLQVWQCVGTLGRDLWVCGAADQQVCQVSNTEQYKRHLEKFTAKIKS